MKEQKVVTLKPKEIDPKYVKLEYEIQQVKETQLKMNEGINTMANNFYVAIDRFNRSKGELVALSYLFSLGIHSFRIEKVILMKPNHVIYYFSVPNSKYIKIFTDITDEFFNVNHHEFITKQSMYCDMATNIRELLKEAPPNMKSEIEKELKEDEKVCNS
jgi:hypothetical protein